MGIKHDDVKASGEKGFAAEWNKNHVIDDDVDMDQNSWENQVIETGVAFPAGPVAGQMLYRTDLNTLYVNDGTTWIAMGRSPIGSVVAWLKSYTNTPALP